MKRERRLEGEDTQRLGGGGGDRAKEAILLPVSAAAESLKFCRASDKHVKGYYGEVLAEQDENDRNDRRHGREEGLKHEGTSLIGERIGHDGRSQPRLRKEVGTNCSVIEQRREETPFIE